jgi:hypothetical protein
MSQENVEIVRRMIEDAFPPDGKAPRRLGPDGSRYQGGTTRGTVADG